ncbi:acrylyl-CoA reductase family protein [Brochothrix thermosphacta]|uniref:acrylyl-CoA reductase family protein n=1 Tax=Brochothrix thermosphacta TaxID=2756 RepID=UPI00083FD56F|nr:acryloyl-CoA reductase [Brochothrix thermosphacta]ANZ95603.1 quinone oxidoreductase [Brochothrix thermosphacta]ANZ98353.1 quinone oxidoreductase [Brochothrix thermosphacta]MDO7863700.1 acryloyl-CoA reductase [Brochothrix thermosphacta]ODJ63131.1 quinone oxidoreductase [Brochothrix thermosphacta]SOC19453.1 putative oxidoreductase [Brochothrix thermosphacta]
MTEKFKALIVDKQADSFKVGIEEITFADLPVEDVLVKVAYSSINYKDALATIPNGNIVKEYPFIPGVDIAGTVVSSKNAAFKAGDEVIALGYGIGVSHFGGYSEYASLPAEWVIPLPKGLTMKEAMIYGTAGFTAALSIDRLEANGLKPEQGEVLVTGATGGVGSMAVALLADKGYNVVASSGKAQQTAFLQKIGASSVVSREAVYDGKIKALGKQKWAGAVDTVGGEVLASLLSQIKYGGSVAASGLTAGTAVPTMVFPFILRGINLLGIDSVEFPSTDRRALWQRLATDLKPQNLEQLIDEEIRLEDLPTVLPTLLKGQAVGRYLVKL